jgi:hypothetical protein
MSMGSYDALNEKEKSELWLKHIEFDKRRETPCSVLNSIRQELIDEGIILKGFRLADNLYHKYDHDEQGYTTWIFQHDKRNMHSELWHTKKGNKTYYYGKLINIHMTPLNKMSGFKFLPLLQQRHK